MSYTSGEGHIEVGPGDIIEAQGFRYEVAASGASDAHVETAGGVKLYVLPGSSGYNVLAFGADPTGTNDSHASIQKALDLGEVLFPEGEFTVHSPLFYGSYTKVTGAGRWRTYIKSEVVGDSLFKPSGGVVGLYMADFTLLGNNIVGENGNGHALNLMDPDASGSEDETASPQHVTIERVVIRRFRGLDYYNAAKTDKISACGVAMSQGTVMVLRDVMTDSCGHGFWAYQQSNVRFDNCVAYLSDKMGLAVAHGMNVIFENGHIISYADGTPDPGYPSLNMGSCGILDFDNRNFVFRGNKVKNMRGGSSVVRVWESISSLYDSNRIEPDGDGTSPNRGVYAYRPIGIQITNNYFRPTSNAGPKYEFIEVYNPFNAPISAVIEGNSFNATSTGVAYCVKLAGNANARQIQAILKGNYFGSANPSLATAVDTDILLENCKLVASEISRNTHFVQANVTQDAIIKADNVLYENTEIGPNAVFVAGTLTAEYDGTFPTP